jgi:hypothetical protein
VVCAIVDKTWLSHIPCSRSGSGTEILRPRRLRTPDRKTVVDIFGAEEAIPSEASSYTLWAATKRICDCALHLIIDGSLNKTDTDGKRPEKDGYR